MVHFALLLTFPCRVYALCRVFDCYALHRDSLFPCLCFRFCFCYLIRVVLAFSVGAPLVRFVLFLFSFSLLGVLLFAVCTTFLGLLLFRLGYSNFYTLK